MSGAVVALLIALLVLDPGVALSPPALAETLLHDPALELRRGRVRADHTFESGRVGFAVRVDGESSPFRIRPVLVLPGASVTFEADPDVVLRYGAGTARVRAPGRWAWQAPDQPGFVPLRFDAPSGEQIEVVAVVLHPAERAQGGMLGGYRIGSYRSEPLRGLPQFLPPPGFVEVASIDEDIRISPHFTLGELLCKQPGAPRFATFTGALLSKLEIVLEEVNARGIDVGTLTIMSGFRTPWYNRSIGNTTDYSRHLWGDAADVFIDRDGDGDMDDLDGDGQSTLLDAHVLAGVVDELGARSDEGFMAGGMSVYRRNAAHGPFVHIDARGSRARW
jgi:hypothetical protein